MEHPMSLPASGSGFSTPSQSSESSLNHDVHSPYRIEPMTSLPISHSGLLTRNVHRQPSVQAHLSSDSVSPTSSYMGRSVRIPSMGLAWAKHACSSRICKCAPIPTALRALSLHFYPRYLLPSLKALDSLCWNHVMHLVWAVPVWGWLTDFTTNSTALQAQVLRRPPLVLGNDL